MYTVTKRKDKVIRESEPCIQFFIKFAEVGREREEGVGRGKEGKGREGKGREENLVKGF